MTTIGTIHFSSMNIIFLLLVIFFFAAGFRFLYFHLVPFLRYTKAKSWDVVPGKITQVFSDGSWLNLNETTKVSDPFGIKYEFTYQGKNCTSSNISFERGETDLINSRKGFSIAHSSTFLKNLKRNSHVNVRVNPLKLEESTLVINQSFHLKKVLFGVCLIIWAMGFMALSITQNPSETKDEGVVVLEKKSLEEMK